MQCAIEVSPMLTQETSEDRKILVSPSGIFGSYLRIQANLHWLALHMAQAKGMNLLCKHYFRLEKKIPFLKEEKGLGRC